MIFFYFIMYVSPIYCQSSSPEARVDPDKHRKVEFLYPETTKDFDRLPLEMRVSRPLILCQQRRHCMSPVCCLSVHSMQGFCAFNFSVHDRFLLPGNPSIGVLHHRGRYYTFNSKEAADGFASNPDG